MEFGWKKEKSWRNHLNFKICWLGGSQTNLQYFNLQTFNLESLKSALCIFLKLHIMETKSSKQSFSFNLDRYLLYHEKVFFGKKKGKKLYRNITYQFKYFLLENKNSSCLKEIFSIWNGFGYQYWGKEEGAVASAILHYKKQDYFILLLFPLLYPSVPLL